ncbi:hypothetical protein GGX14DRAFT_384228 [Mycena pura]|uniref:F-box domain-containing protein n=1 Tax=Mycena pura TaxID=153505 RepID=A0AAD6YUV7_9AGAR|nr:hypothetical protein GGX14DRAFT_384228 [Mycena pura]
MGVSQHSLSRPLKSLMLAHKSKYHDSFVTAFEYLCIRKNKWIPEKNRTKAANLIFPTTAYAARINKILLLLPNLSTSFGDSGTRQRAIVVRVVRPDVVRRDLSYSRGGSDSSGILSGSHRRVGASGGEARVGREVDNQVVPMSWMASDDTGRTLIFEVLARAAKSLRTGVAWGLRGGSRSLDLHFREDKVHNFGDAAGKFWAHHPLTNLRSRQQSTQTRLPVGDYSFPPASWDAQRAGVGVWLVQKSVTWRRLEFGGRSAFCILSQTSRIMKASPKANLRLYREKSSRTQMVMANNPPVWRQFLEVPPELWSVVAKFCNRHTIARLCCVSGHFYSVFIRLLYGMTTSPPLSTPRAFLLIRALSEGDPEPRTAKLITSIAFPHSPGFGETETQIYQAVLRNLSGSSLRRLEWNLSYNLELLHRALKYFPHLKEISVQCETKYKTSFDFIHIPNLEKLECSLECWWDDESGYGNWDPSWNALRQALKSLPLSSPLLNTLKLELNTHTATEQNPLWAAYTDLIETINDLRFGALTALELSVDIDVQYGSPAGPLADFSTFLRAHPLLTTITLNGRGMRTDPDVKSFPGLRSLTGLVQNCGGVLARARELEQVFLVFDDSGTQALTSETFPPDAGPTVRQLKVGIADEAFPSDISVLSFSYLASAFLNITHLDILVTEPMSHYRASFVTLLSLQHICIRERVYAKEIHKILPDLSNLAKIDLVLRGRRQLISADIPCPSCCDSDGAEAHAPQYPDLELDLRFCVDRTRGKAELLLVRKEAADKRSFPAIETGSSTSYYTGSVPEVDYFLDYF